MASFTTAPVSGDGANHSSRQQVLPIFSSSSEADDADPLLIEMTRLSEHLLKGSPKLDAVFKNMIALFVARSQLTDEALSVSTCLSMTRVILACMQAHELAESTVWGQTHMQGEDQPAEARILQLTRYKVARLLRNRALERQQKLYKLFGVEYLLWTHCWPEVKLACLASPPTTVAEDIFQEFLSVFEQALDLMDGESVERSERKDGAEDAGDDELVKEALEEVAQVKIAANCDLIFAKDFQAALLERKEKRARDVRAGGEAN